MKKFYYDLETTGLDNSKCAIHQLSGAIEIDGEIKEYFNIKMRPFDGAQIAQEALNVSNLTIDIIMRYNTPEIGFQTLMMILNRYVNKFDKKDKFFLVGYNNSSFDDPFLKNFYIRYGDKFFYSYFWVNSIDVMTLATEHLAYKRHLMENFKLVTVARELGLTVDETKLHEASYDIDLTISLYRELSKIRPSLILND